MNDFDTLAAGDRVGVLTGQALSHYTVSRVTPAHFWLQFPDKQRRFRKSDGLLINSHYPKRYAIQHSIIKGESK